MPGRGGRRGGRGSGQPMTREVQVSKALSWLLRHGAQSSNLELGKGGYASLQAVLNVQRVKSLKPSLQEIKEIVRNNEKQRFSLIYQTPDAAAAEDSEQRSGVDVDDNDPSHYLIRANQGHSIKVDDSDLLTPITIEAGNVPEVVVHGTRRETWSKIAESGGLKPMGRNHVHFATGLPPQLRKSPLPAAGAEDVQGLSDKDGSMVISGMRVSSTLFIFLDLPKALNAGIKFWLSENGVVLTEGNGQGLVPIELFSRVEERDGKKLVENGVVAGQ